VRHHRKRTQTCSSPLGSSTPGSCTSSSPPNLPEWTKGDEHDYIVPADRAVTIESTVASIWDTLHTKHISRSRALGRTTRGFTPFTLAGPRSDLTISDRMGTPYTRTDPPSPKPDIGNPNPNGLGSNSPPRLSPLRNRVIYRVIWLPPSTWTQPVISHLGIVIDAHPSDSMVWQVQFSL
jgi:hypothetical protein